MIQTRAPDGIAPGQQHGEGHQDLGPARCHVPGTGGGAGQGRHHEGGVRCRETGARGLRETDQGLLTGEGEDPTRETVGYRSDCGAGVGPLFARGGHGPGEGDGAPAGPRSDCGARGLRGEGATADPPTGAGPGPRSSPADHPNVLQTWVSDCFISGSSMVRWRWVDLHSLILALQHS